MSFEPAFGAERLSEADERAGEFDLSHWLQVLRRRKMLLVVVVAVVLAASVVLFAITPKRYSATTIIQIERNTVSLVGGDSLFAAEPFWDQEFFPTQYRLLQSRGLAERVVKNLRLADDPAFNPARASLVGAKSAGGATAADDQARLGGLAGRLLGGLEVNPIRNTRLVEITYQAPTAQLAARVANGVADAFIDWNIESRYATVGKASTFLAQQIEALKAEIQDKETQLQAYSRRTDIVALDPASNVTIQRLESLNKDYMQAMSDRINKESQYQQLMQAPDEAAAESASGGLVAQLRGEQLKLERDYATKLNIYKPDWPAMQELKAQIEKGRQNLQAVIGDTVTKAREAARADYQTALRREQSLSAELERQKSEAMKMNSAAVEYNNLKLEVSTRRQLLDDLLRKQSETEVASRLQGTRESNVRIVDRALVPAAPFRPSLRRNVTLGLMLGLMLGLVAIVLVEYLDRTLKTPDDVDRVLRTPVLAVIPDLEAGTSGAYAYAYGRRSKSSGTFKAIRGSRAVKAMRGAATSDANIDLLPHTQPRHPACEAYRTLRTALLLSTPEELRSVVVTSAVPGEGKTATAVNLAVVLAQVGKRVVLVDGDLRKPRLHRVFNVSNRTGLVNVLASSANEIADLIHPTDAPNLSVVPSGPIPPNPSELLASERMRSALHALQQMFDVVVIDTPPTLPVTDSTILGALSDGVVLCVGAGQVVREDAVTCRDRLQLSGDRLLGVVLNRFRRQRAGFGGDYSYYESYYASDGDGDGEPTGRAAKA